MDEIVQENWSITRVKGDQVTEEVDVVAVEFPITIMLKGKEFATIVCSPTHVRELVIGFLASEGVILFGTEIKQMHIDAKKGFVHVSLDKEIDASIFEPSKRFIGSCCGKSRQFYFKSDVKTAKTIINHPITISAKQCYRLMEKMQAESTFFQMTGGVHNAALCTVNEIIAIWTDIGRHNALDKLYGHMIDHRTPASDKIIVFSGRISSEVLLKAAKIGAAIMISKSAPTDLAIKLAVDLGITVAGFVRNSNINIYTHSDRITF
jgi:FdhD protein